MLEFEYPTGLLDANPPYWFTTVRGAELAVQEYDGQPKNAEHNAVARVLVLEPGGGDADVFVSQYGADLGYVTDTWYTTLEEALNDLEEMYGDDLDRWQPVPEKELDAELYVLRYVARGGSEQNEMESR